MFSGLHQSKVRGTAKASTRVGNDCVCSFWKSSEMPPSDHDSSVESVKTCPKTSESEVCRSSDLSGDPLDAMSVGGEPPSILIRRTLPTSMPTLAKPTLVKPTGQTNLTISWERIVYDDCVRLCLIVLQSFPLSKLYVDPIHNVLMHFPLSCKMQDVVL